MTKVAGRTPIATGSILAGGLVRQIFNQLGVALASKLVPLAAIFIYSRMMSVGDYGLLNLFQSYIWIFVLALSLNLHVGVGRYIYLPSADTGRFLGTTLLAVGGVFVVGAIGAMLLAPRAEVLLGLPMVALPAMLAIVAGQIAESLLTQVAIHDQRSGLLLRAVAGKALLSLALAISLLVARPGAGWLAVLVADAASSLLMVTIVLAVLWPRIEWVWRAEHLAYMARYALPLVPYMLGLTLLSQFDRVLINRFHGREATGLYSLSYNLGTLLLMLATAVLNALNPAFFDAMNRGEHQRVHRDSRMVFSIALVAAASLVLVGPDLATILLPTRYAPGFALIPVVALGGLCFVVFQTWVRVLAFDHRTVMISAITVAGAALNVALNLWLLPAHGWAIAAWTTVAAYAAMTIACLLAIAAVPALPRPRVGAEGAWIAAIAVVVLAMPHNVPLVLRLATLSLVAASQRAHLASLVQRGR